MTMVKAERLIRILRLLEEGEAVSIEQLSRATGRTERTIWRDLAGLRAMDVPIRIEEGLYQLDRVAWRNWKGSSLKLVRRRGEG